MVIINIAVFIRTVKTINWITIEIELLLSFLPYDISLLRLTWVIIYYQITTWKFWQQGILQLIPEAIIVNFLQR